MPPAPSGGCPCPERTLTPSRRPWRASSSRPPTRGRSERCPRSCPETSTRPRSTWRAWHPAPGGPCARRWSRLPSWCPEGASPWPTLDWAALRYQHTAAIRAVLLEGHAPATVNKMLSAVRGVLKEAWRLGQPNAEAYGRAADLPSIRGSGSQKGRALTSGELRGLFETCAADETPAGTSGRGHPGRPLRRRPATGRAGGAQSKRLPGGGRDPAGPARQGAQSAHRLRHRRSWPGTGGMAAATR